MSPFRITIAASLAFAVLASLPVRSAETGPAAGPSAGPPPQPAHNQEPPTRLVAAHRFCADRCAAPVVGLTCGLTHIVDPPSFRAAVKPCVWEIDAAGEPDWRMTEE